MAKLHHTQLKAAVSKYGPLLGTMPEDLFKAEIAKDEKLKDNVDEVFTAISEADKGNGPGSNLDRQNNEGDHFNEESLKGFVDSLTDEQAQLLYNAVAEKLGTDKIDWAHLENLQSKANQSEDKAVGEHYVIAPFMDRSDATLRYSIGQNVDHLPADRLAELVEKGLVEKQ